MLEREKADGNFRVTQALDFKELLLVIIVVVLRLPVHKVSLVDILGQLGRLNVNNTQISVSEVPMGPGKFGHAEDGFALG